MSIPKLIISIILCLILMIFNTSCDQLVEKKRRVFIVLVDYSSSNNEETLNNYIRIVNEIIFSNLNQYDCLTVVPIDEGSKIKPLKLIHEDLVNQKFTQHTDGFSHANDSLRLRFSQYVEKTSPKITEILKIGKIKRKVFTEHTDILGAIQQTTNLIEFNPNGGKLRNIEDFVLGRTRLKSENIIVLLSDMVQNSQECSFNLKAGFTYNKSVKYLERLKKSNQIPDLKDCKVFAIGVTGRNSNQIDNIAYFWDEYFKLTSAELKAYGYSVEDKLKRYIIESN